MMSHDMLETLQETIRIIEVVCDERIHNPGEDDDTIFTNLKKLYTIVDAMKKSQ